MESVDGKREVELSSSGRFGILLHCSTTVGESFGGSARFWRDRREGLVHETVRRKDYKAPEGQEGGVHAVCQLMVCAVVYGVLKVVSDALHSPDKA